MEYPAPESSYLNLIEGSVSVDYNICGVPITKEHALRIAKQSLRIHLEFPSDNKSQDEIDVRDARREVYKIEKDIIREKT
jgi:hypothetical protein